MAESPLAGVELHLVQSLDDALAMKRWAGERRETPLGVDIETTGLDRLRDRVRLIQLGDKRHGWAMPDIWAGAAVEIMREYEGEFAGHNIFAFDRPHIARSLGYEIPWHKIHDTMFLAALVNPLVPKGLKPLSSRLIDRNAAAGQRLLDDGMKANKWTWATVPYDYPPFWSYGALDPVLTTHLFEILYPQVHGSADEAYDLERAVAPLLGGMMDRGLLVDQSYARAKISELREYEVSVRSWLKSAYGIDSLMSARQIAAALAAAGVEIAGTTKTGLPSVTKEVLGGISKSQDAPEAARELSSAILRARHADKICGTYLESFLELMDSDGAIHPSINQLAARTGRMTCNSPNLQNLPRDDRVVRGAFRPRSEFAYISCDFSQVEMRIFASLSEDAGLIEAFRHADETGTDFYAVLATELFGEPVSKKSPKRQNVKSASYARIFGAGLAKMAATAGVSPEQMKPVNDALGQRYPGMNSLPGRIIAQARAMQSRGEQPHVRTSTGRYLPCDPDRLFSLVNYLCQGSAAEQLKRAITNVASAGLAEYMLVPVHDEILFEIPLSQVDEMKRVIVEAMTDNETFSVPITCDASVMTERWVKS